MGCVRAGHGGEAWLKKGLLVCSKQRCPSSLTQDCIEARRRVMDLVVIGMDSQKRKPRPQAAGVLVVPTQPVVEGQPRRLEAVHPRPAGLPAPPGNP